MLAYQQRVRCDHVFRLECDTLELNDQTCCQDTGWRSQGGTATCPPRNTDRTDRTSGSANPHSTTAVSSTTESGKQDTHREFPSLYHDARQLFFADCREDAKTMKYERWSTTDAQLYFEISPCLATVHDFTETALQGSLEPSVPSGDVSKSGPKLPCL